MNDKIKQILVDKSISPSHFADEIGVQRSSISHILAGRNKPSLDIVQKIVRRYPDLGMDWIWDEDDSPLLEPAPKPYTASTYPPQSGRNGYIPNGSDFYERPEPRVAPVQPNLRPQESTHFAEKSIERILIFYSDGTFKQYTPQ